MKKSWIALAATALILLIVGGTVAGTFNSLVSSKENVSSKLSAIDAQYQRRLDLIPQLVSTVAQAVKSERKTLEAVVKARAAATETHLGENPSAAEIAAFQKAQAGVGQSLGRLIAISEAYPDLKSTQGFLDLQAQLEGTENRITVARTDYNDAARSYNTSIASFPTVILAGMFGHSQRFEYFTAVAGADVAPTLNFDDK